MRPQVIMGECKTFDSFDEDDAKRLSTIARDFPEAILVLASFKDTLSDDEKRLLKPLASARREQRASPLMILTRHELSSDFVPPHCWKDGSLAHQALYDAVTRAPAPHVSLRRLADATQQLYLEMSADPDWPFHAV
jgi:hypothetical protein